MLTEEVGGRIFNQLEWEASDRRWSHCPQFCFGFVFLLGDFFTQSSKGIIINSPAWERICVWNLFGSIWSKSKYTKWWWCWWVDWLFCQYYYIYIYIDYMININSTCMYVLLSINLCQVNNQECFSLLTSSDIEGEMKGEMSCHDFQEHLCPWNLEGLLPQSFKAWWNILKKNGTWGGIKTTPKHCYTCYTENLHRRPKR